MKPFYSDFVRHCLRYYVKTLDEGHDGRPIFNGEADKANWSACFRVLKEYSQDDIDIISEIYRQRGNIDDSVYLVARAKRVPPGAIWNLINATERKIAKKRGLL